MASIFSQIIAGAIPCYKIYENEKVLAFLDIHPEVKGHALVVPKVEVDKIYELEEGDFRALMEAVKKISVRMEEVMEARVIWKVIGTDVPHAHVHVMPLSEGWVQGKTLEVGAEEMEEIRQRLAMV